MEESMVSCSGKSMAARILNSLQMEHQSRRSRLLKMLVTSRVRELVQEVHFKSLPRI
jgi:hypothetical protein